MAELLLSEGERRHALNPALWPMAADARVRIERAVAASFEPAAHTPPELWMLAEAGGRVVGVSHGMVVPPPPIYAVPGRPGLILDDSFTLAEAPEGTARDLLAATEAGLKDMGAAGLIASSLEAGPWRPLFDASGYQPITFYMAKHGFATEPAPASTRPAGAEDVPAIVRLSARHRATLQQLNARFWPTHPGADRRFEGWMRHSLTLTDRDMIVTGPPGDVVGYAIAQPITALHIPAGHDLAPVGTVDDFYAIDFADVVSLTDGGRNAADLLAAAERAFARRGVQAALVVCPAAWASKKALLERQGYRTAKLWMLKA
jgi:hypothetical protein